MNKCKKHFNVLLAFFNFLLSNFLLYSSSITTSNTNKELIEKYFNQGVNYYIMRDFQNAAEMWRKVLELEPTHQQAKIYFENAFEKYQTMMVNYYKGIDAYKKDNCKEAISYFKKSLNINPRFEKCRNYLNLAYECLKIKIKIVDKPLKEANEVGDVNLTTDDVLTLYAIGFDGKGRYVGEVEVKWETTGTLDPINETNQFSSFIRYVPKTFGTEGRIKASVEGAEPDETGVIKVFPGKLAYIKILNGPGLSGDEINYIKITTDQTLKMYAAGFDKTGTYIGDIPVDWLTEVENALYTNTINSSEFIFNPSRAYAKTKIIARSKSGPYAEITNITILPGNLKYVRIEDSPNQGNEVYSLDLTTDDTITFYAAGYDSKNNFISNVNVNWYSEIPCENVNMSNVSQFSFSPTKSSIEGKVKISRRDVIGDDTGVIKVLPGKVAKLNFIKDETFRFEENFNVVLFTESKISAEGYDRKNNFVKKLSGNWYLNYNNTNFMVASNTEYVKLYFTNVITNAKLFFESPEISGSASFNVLLPDIAYLKLMDLTNQQIVSNIILKCNDEISLISVGFDLNGNYIKPVNCLWETSKTLDKFLNNFAVTNKYIAKKCDTKGEIFLYTEKLGKIRVGAIEILPPPLAQVETKKIIIYIVYNGDTLSEIIAKKFYISDKWNVLIKYINAIAKYNNLSNVDLIFPRQKIFIPYFSVEEPTTKEELSLKLFGDKNLKDKIVLYNKPKNVENINPDDKIIIKDFDFLSTGKLNFGNNSNLKSDNEENE